MEGGGGIHDTACYSGSGPGTLGDQEKNGVLGMTGRRRTRNQVVLDVVVVQVGYSGR